MRSTLPRRLGLIVSGEERGHRQEIVAVDQSVRWLASILGVSSRPEQMLGVRVSGWDDQLTGLKGDTIGALGLLKDL